MNEREVRTSSGRTVWRGRHVHNFASSDQVTTAEWRADLRSESVNEGAPNE